MKNLFFGIFIFVSAIGLAQNNQLVQNAKWYVSTYGKNGSNGCYYRRDFNQYFNGDTIINSNQYFKLSEVGNYYITPAGQPGACPSTSYFYSYNLPTLVRYYQKKLLVWSSATAQDSVFLDYNLRIGDTITNVGFSKPYGSNIKLLITNIDSVIVNGQYLKRFYYDGAMGPKYIIEKIGSIQGFLNPYSYDFESGSSLNCYSENQVTLYNEPSSSLSCNMTLGIKESVTTEDNYIIYPIPTNDKFKIESKNNGEIKNISVKNQLGQVILEFKKTSGNTTYDISELKNGMYFISIDTENGSFTKKIIKE